MFYFDNIKSKKILKSTLIEGAEVFFTTKESFIKTKEPKFLDIATENKNNICEYLGIKKDYLISPEQTHSDNIKIVDTANKYPDTDALIIEKPAYAIYLSYADCTPVVLYDTKNNIAAVIHAGWRGTAKNIATKTLAKMNSNPKDIQALIGPCICFDCFETGVEVIKELEKTIDKKDKLFKQMGEKYFADLKNINAQQLKEKGVENIDICPFCTFCNNGLFFSYRRENKTTSRISAVLKLN